MDIEKYNVQKLKNKDLQEINGGGFLAWALVTILVSCINSPEDFTQGLKDSVK